MVVVVLFWQQVFVLSGFDWFDASETKIERQFWFSHNIVRVIHIMWTRAFCSFIAAITLHGKCHFLVSVPRSKWWRNKRRLTIVTAYEFDMIWYWLLPIPYEPLCAFVCVYVCWNKENTKLFILPNHYSVLFVKVVISFAWRALNDTCIDKCVCRAQCARHKWNKIAEKTIDSIVWFHQQRRKLFFSIFHIMHALIGCFVRLRRQSKLIRPNDFHSISLYYCNFVSCLLFSLRFNFILPPHMCRQCFAFEHEKVSYFAFRRHR